jgi:hypothetical protein
MLMTIDPPPKSKVLIQGKKLKMRIMALVNQVQKRVKCLSGTLLNFRYLLIVILIE